MLFAVVPMVIVAILSFWGGVGVLGVVLIVLALVIVVFDSWANRPYKKSGPRSSPGPASRISPGPPSGPAPRYRGGR